MSKPDTPDVPPPVADANEHTDEVVETATEVPDPPAPPESHDNTGERLSALEQGLSDLTAMVTDMAPPGIADLDETPKSKPWTAGNPFKRK